MGNSAIHVENLGKQFHIGAKQERYYALRDTLTDVFRAPFRRALKLLRGQATGAAELDEILWALKDISFTVKHGEVVGIIGKNGAGKSTLLKILSRITEPTTGFAEIHGRVGSLLEVGTGFHPELTGRENIYLNGAILGMKRAEIGHKFDEIVDFAEVEKFIDTPVKHYSSGMYLRLAFAVAAHLEPEILLVDEVLAVGDAAFQKKCLGKMGEVAREGRTVLLVSHNMGAIAQLCGEVIWIEKGQLELIGPSSSVITSYLSSETQGGSIWTNTSTGSGDNRVHVKCARILSPDNKPIATGAFNKQFQVQIVYEVFDSSRNLSIICRVHDLQGNVVWTSWDTDTTDWNGKVREPGQYLSICQVPECSLRPGRYLFTIGALSQGDLLEWHDKVLSFDISAVGYPLNLNRLGVITPLLRWEIKTENANEKA